jgi:hypothetical protein
VDTLKVIASTTINAGVTLTLNAGIEIIVSDNVAITVLGALIVNGSPTDSVIFKPVTDSIWWKGITFDNANSTMSNDSSIIKFASFRRSNFQALTIRSFSKLRVSNSSFSDCAYGRSNKYIQESPFKGSAVSVLQSSVSFDSCSFSNNYCDTTFAYNGYQYKFIQGGAIYAQNSSINIINSIFTSNYAQYGGGVYARKGSIHIKNCIFTKNRGLNGGAVLADSLDYLRVEGCTFRNNKFLNADSSKGGSIFTKGTMTEIYGCMFESPDSNSASGAGAAIYASCDKINLFRDTVRNFKTAGARGSPAFILSDSLKMIHCILTGNYTSNSDGGAVYASGKVLEFAGILAARNNAHSSINACAGGAIYAKATEKAWFTNCTMVFNKVSDDVLIKTSSGGALFTSGNSVLANNLFWGNTAESQPQVSGGSQMFNNTIYDASWYPQFVDTAAGNYRLSDKSPFIDCGYILADKIPETDLDGNPRQVHQSVDLGAYEYNETRPTALSGWFTRDTIIGPGDLTIQSPCLYVLDGKRLRITAGTTLHFPTLSRLDVYGSLETEGTKNAPVLFTSAKTTWAGISIYDKGRLDLTDDDIPSILRGTIIEKGTSCYALKIGANTKATITGSAIRDMDYVYGIYVDGGAFAKIDSCHFYNLNANSNGESSISAVRTSTLVGTGSILDSTYHSVSFDGNTRLDGWTFRNCRVGTGNVTSLMGCLFDSSFVEASDSLQLVNSILTNGPASQGVVQTYGASIKIINCAIVDNHYFAVSATLNGTSYLQIHNSIIWNNYGGGGVPQLSINGTVTPLVMNTCIEGGYTGGTANIIENPLFTNSADRNYIPLEGSPCINAGDTTGVMKWLYPKDYAGNHRIRDGRIDIGPFEFQKGAIFENWGEPPVTIARKPIVNLGAPSMVQFHQMNNKVTIHMSGWNKSPSVVITNLHGKVVFCQRTTTTPNMSISPPAMARGLYLMTITDGTMKIREKVLIK